MMSEDHNFGPEKPLEKELLLRHYGDIDPERIDIMPQSNQQALTYLRTALANPAAEFRPGQWEAIDALVNHRKKLLVVERTGWGKSSVYFI